MNRAKRIAKYLKKTFPTSPKESCITKTKK